MKSPNKTRRRKVNIIQRQLTMSLQQIHMTHQTGPILLQTKNLLSQKSTSWLTILKLHSKRNFNSQVLSPINPKVRRRNLILTLIKKKFKKAKKIVMQKSNNYLMSRPKNKENKVRRQFNQDSRLCLNKDQGKIKDQHKQQLLMKLLFLKQSKLDQK